MNAASGLLLGQRLIMTSMSMEFISDDEGMIERKLKRIETRMWVILYIAVELTLRLPE